jgi:hypothetical protein
MKENVLRFFASGTAGAGHEHPFYYFIPNLFLGMAPWSFFFLPLAVFLYQRRYTWEESSVLYLIVWIATVFLFYSASNSKRSVYILPLYPAIALLLGAWWQELKNGTVALPPTFSWLLRGGGYLSFLSLSCAVAIVLGQLFGYDVLALIRPLLHPKDQNNLPFFAGIVFSHPLALLLWFCVIVPSALLLLQSTHSQQWGKLFIALVAFVSSTFLLINNVFQPAVATARTFRPFMHRVVERVGNSPLFFYQAFDNGALYYAGRHIPFYDPALVQRGQLAFLLTWEDEWKKLATQDSTQLKMIDISEGTGPKGNHRLVLVFIPPGATVPTQNPQSEDDDNGEEDTL